MLGCLYNATVGGNQASYSLCVFFLVLFLAFVAASAADLVLMRFTFELVEMYFNDRSAASSLEQPNSRLPCLLCLCSS